MTRKLRVGGAQMGPIQKAEGRETVVARMLRLMDRARAETCDLIVYPELALTTFFPRWYAEDRAEMFGLSHEICGESGFGWCRRLMMLAPMLDGASDDAPAPEPVARLGARYGYQAAQAEAAPARVASILTLLADRLHEQRGRGSRYLIGDTLTAVDLHWTAFAAMVEPLPEDQCPMPRGIRAGYQLAAPVAGLIPDPILLEHRDFVYERHLALPLDF